MIDKGAKLKVIDVEGWYDAGKLETLLDTNRVILQKGAARTPDRVGHDVKLFDPVYVEDGVTIRNSTIGPNVSLGRGTVVEGSQLRDTIIGEESRIIDSTLTNSLVGEAAVVEGVRGSITIADHSEIHAEAPEATTKRP